MIRRCGNDKADSYMSCILAGIMLSHRSHLHGWLLLIASSGRVGLVPVYRPMTRPVSSTAVRALATIETNSPHVCWQGCRCCSGVFVSGTNSMCGSTFCEGIALVIQSAVQNDTMSRLVLARFFVASRSVCWSNQLHSHNRPPSQGEQSDS